MGRGASEPSSGALPWLTLSSGGFPCRVSTEVSDSGSKSSGITSIGVSCWGPSMIFSDSSNRVTNFFRFAFATVCDKVNHKFNEGGRP